MWPARSVAAGPGVTRFRVGDEVFGFGRGTFAEYTAAREDKLARMPAGLTFEQAAVVPVSGVTALNALTVACDVRAGQKVLVTGASGGVGSYAVQLARALGAEVTGVCSTAKTSFVRSLGAAHVIDYTQDDFADGARRYDLIVDIAGNPALSRLRCALTPTGTADLTARGQRQRDRHGPGVPRTGPVTVPAPAADHAHPPAARQRPRTGHRVP